MAYQTAQIMQPPYSGMPMQPTVVVQAGVPFQPAYYPNNNNNNNVNNPISINSNFQQPLQQPQNGKVPVYDNSIEVFALNQMNSLKSLIEKAEKYRDLESYPISPFAVRWRYVLDPYPSFWYGSDKDYYDVNKNDSSEFSMKNDIINSNPFLKTNISRSTTPSPPAAVVTPQTVAPGNMTINGGIPMNMQINSNPNTSYIQQQPRAQTPQASIVPTNFVPQRQQSPELLINSPKVIPNMNDNLNDQQPIGLASSSAPGSLNSSNNVGSNISMNDTVNANSPDAANMVDSINNGYNDGREYNNGYNHNNYNGNINYQHNNSYHNGSTNGSYNGGYNNGYNNGYGNNSYNNNTNNNNNLGYQKNGLRPNNKKQHTRKRRTGTSQWTYKPEQ